MVEAQRCALLPAALLSSSWPRGDAAGNLNAGGCPQRRGLPGPSRPAGLRASATTAAPPRQRPLICSARQFRKTPSAHTFLTRCIVCCRRWTCITARCSSSALFVEHRLCGLYGAERGAHSTRCGEPIKLRHCPRPLSPSRLSVPSAPSRPSIPRTARRGKQGEPIIRTPKQ